MRATTLNRWITGTFLTLMLSAGCATAAPRTRVYVRVGPPGAVVDVRPGRPGPNYVWIDGYHRWDGRGYAWTAGRWVVPPHGRHVWVPARWAHDHHGWYLVEGHWRA